MSTFRNILCGFVVSLTLIVSVRPAAADEEAQDPNRPIKDKWAVVIGVSQFSDSQIPQLKYPAKDAKDFADFLVNKENFARDHVLLLTDKKATKVKILEAFGDGWLPQRVMRDDLVVIFISTHGSPADKAGENFIIAHDSDPSHPYATGIRLQDLSRELTNRTGCDRLVLLLDACHSGAAVSESKGILRAPSNFNLDAITGSGQLVISSSQSQQVSWESKRYPNGVFTGQLMQALQKNGPQTTLDDAFAHLKSGVETEVRFDRMSDQTPVMLDRWKGIKLALAVKPSEPRSIPPDLPDETSEPPAATRIATAPPNSVVRSVAPIAPQMPQRPNQLIQPSSQYNPAAPPVARTNNTLPSFMSTSWTNPGSDPTLERGTRLVSDQEVQGLSKQQITCLYNEAYARHGRGFSTAYIRTYFQNQPWYREDPDYHWRPDDPRVKARNGQTDDMPVINEKRTPKQWANMQLLKRWMDAK